MKKRSVKISGHYTSVTLEDEFWDALKHIAQSQNKSLNGIISEIDNTRTYDNLSSAIRVYVLRMIQLKPGP